MPSTVAQIRKSVEEILKAQNISSLPIDVKRVARSLGADVVEKDLDHDTSGLLAVTHGKRTIAYNSAHSENRQRFTIAHEIGHLVLHAAGIDHDDIFIDKKVYNRNSQASQGIYRQEIEANRFAAELLMPKKMLLITIKEFGGDIDLSDDIMLGKLARKFEVSAEALAIRLANLAIVPSI